ncbi:hypothetical protein MTOK_40950 [Mycolicibacterium tokaiense]|nr:hypothetical protein MTOK_40950 [Mycolicibacterium tokaiense]
MFAARYAAFSEAARQVSPGEGRMYGATSSFSVSAHQPATSTATSSRGRQLPAAVRRTEKVGSGTRGRRGGVGSEADAPEGRTPAGAVNDMECPLVRSDTGLLKKSGPDLECAFRSDSTIT